MSNMMLVVLMEVPSGEMMVFNTAMETTGDVDGKMETSLADSCGKKGHGGIFLNPLTDNIESTEFQILTPLPPPSSFH